SDRRRLELELKAKQLLVQGGVSPQTLGLAVEKEVARDPGLTKLLHDIEALEVEAAKVERMATRGKDEPILKRYHQDLATLRAAAEARRKMLRPRAREELKSLSQRDLKSAVEGLEQRSAYLAELEKALNDAVERFRKEAQSTTIRQADIESFKLEIAQTERMAERVGAEVERLKIERDAPERVTKLEDASASMGNSERQRLKAPAGAGGMAFFLIVGFIAWREYRLRRLDSVKEVSQELGLTVVGTLPLLPDRRALLNHQSEADWKGQLTESVDATR